MNQTNQNTNPKAYVFVPEQFVVIARKEVLTEVGMLVIEKKMVKEGTTEKGIDIYVEAEFEVPGGVLILQ